MVTSIVFVPIHVFLHPQVATGSRFSPVALVLRFVLMIVSGKSVLDGVNLPYQHVVPRDAATWQANKASLQGVHKPPRGVYAERTCVVSPPHPYTLLHPWLPYITTPSRLIVLHPFCDQCGVACLRVTMTKMSTRIAVACVHYCP
uniref:Uncharacterized protein n=1 Tax=Lygus hesperus TaxID=30085 RepID=A0A146LW31_LYGHE